MNTFAKTTFIAFFLLLGITANAQESAARFGVKAGLNYSGYTSSGPGHKVGLNIGVTLDFRVSSSWYILTGLDYLVKGGKGSYMGDYDEIPGKITNSETPTYLQLPLHVGYKLPVSREIDVMFHGGFYLAYGIGGKVHTEFESSEGNISKEHKMDYFGVGVGKGDYGIGLGANVEFRKFVASLGYDMGLRKPAKMYGDGKITNAYFTIGYKF